MPLPPEGERDRLIQDTLEKYRRYLNPSWVAGFKFAGLDTLEWEAEGVVIRDIHGRELLDFACGPAVFVLGHRHPRVVAAARAELDRMPMSVRIMPNRPMAELAAVLAEVTPGDLQYSFFANSGAEANEGALKLARLATGRTDVVATEGAFHGKTFGALSASGRDLYRTPFQPLVPGFSHVPFGDAAAIERAITDRTAAVILEPIQGENGVVIPPAGYLREVREICDRHGVLLIADEVQSGLGRTGKMWAVEWEDVVPDILTTAKGLGGGVAPVGALVARPHLWTRFIENTYLHSTTFGNRLGWAAAVATIRTIQDDGLLDHVRRTGDRFLAGLRDLAAHYPWAITDVRGKGFWVGVEFGDSDIAFLVLSEMATRGVLVYYALNKPQVLRLAPPLIAQPEHFDRCLAAMQGALEDTRRLLGEIGVEIAT